MLTGIKHGWGITVLQSRVNLGPASFSVSCLQSWSAVYVPLPLISLKNDPVFDSDNLCFTTVNIQTYRWPGELESLDIWFV